MALVILPMFLIALMRILTVQNSRTESSPNGPDKHTVCIISLYIQATRAGARRTCLIGSMTDGLGRSMTAGRIAQPELPENRLRGTRTGGQEGTKAALGARRGQPLDEAGSGPAQRHPSSVYNPEQVREL
eukprot:358288-Chlamydomonas_euryale.AAC.7